MILKLSIIIKLSTLGLLVLKYKINSDVKFVFTFGVKSIVTVDHVVDILDISILVSLTFAFGISNESEPENFSLFLTLNSKE